MNLKVFLAIGLCLGLASALSSTADHDSVYMAAASDDTKLSKEALELKYYYNSMNTHGRTSIWEWFLILLIVIPIFACYKCGLFDKKKEKESDSDDEYKRA